MNENGKKRREWVKNAAIVFLTVMLLLTFFSQTIMNYSLPEVATQFVQSGSITAKIRGSGTVESGDPYEVKVTESRKVASVAVRAGDVVQKGDVLFYLEDKDSEELQAALEELKTAEDAYEKALLSTDVTSSDINAAENGISLDEYRKQITAKQNAIKAAENALKAAENDVKEAQKVVDEAQNWYDRWGIQISITPANKADVGEETKVRDETKKALENAQSAALEAKNNLTAKQNAAEELDGRVKLESANSGENSEQTLELKRQLKEAQNEVLNAQSSYNEKALEVDLKQQAYDRAEQLLADKIASGDTTEEINSLKRQQTIAGQELADAKDVLIQKQGVVTERQTALATREKELADFKTQIDRVGGLQAAREAIDKAQKKVDELREKTTGATITAPISGTVSTLNVIAGNTTSAATPVAIMQPEGKGYTLSFSVTTEQARRLSVGDKADLVNSWRYGDVEVTLASIKPDTTDPGHKKLLTFDVTGTSVVAGQSLSLSVGQKSANYDLIVPNSSIREDNNGKFILIVESSQSPLGTRYTASRVDVEVLASDDTQSAISGALYGHEFVITTSTKPVEAGKLVRLAD